MKNRNLYLIPLLSCIVIQHVSAETIVLTNEGTGSQLDGIQETPTTISVIELDGLDLMVEEISGGSLNATQDSLGINGDNDTDTDAFESAFNQSVTFSFNKTVSITQLDLRGFEDGEIFNFDGLSISYETLANKTTDIYDFATAYIIEANTAFVLSTGTGTIGIEGITLTVVPEPSYTQAILLTCGTALLMRRRRHPART
jgi:hypothetical protein